jgi:hypothetical protein
MAYHSWPTGEELERLPVQQEKDRAIVAPDASEDRTSLTSTTASVAEQDEMAGGAWTALSGLASVSPGGSGTGRPPEQGAREGMGSDLRQDVAERSEDSSGAGGCDFAAEADVGGHGGVGVA